MSQYSNYQLGKKGVNVDVSPVHADPDELLLAQNAVRDPLGSDGGLKNRDGLVKFTADLSGSVLGGIAMPVFNYTDTRTLYTSQTDSGTNKWYSSSDLFSTSAAVSAIGAWKDPTDFYSLAARRPACFFNGQLYYASNNYTPGTTSPNIRVYNGSDDRELCRVLPATAKGIVSITASRGYMWVLVLESGTTDADFVGTVWRLDESGHLTKIGASLTTGYVPTAIIYYNNRIFVAGSRLTTTSESIIWTIDPLSGTTTWTTDLAGNADDYYVGGFASFKGLLYAVTANGGAATKGKILQRSLAGSWSTVDSTTNNGGSFEDIVAYEGYLYASSRNYATTTTTCVIRRSSDGSSWATVSNSASTPGFGVFSSIGLRVFCSHSTKFQYASAADGTSWTFVTAPGSSNLGASLGVLLITGAPTWQEPVGSTTTPTVNVTNVSSTTASISPHFYSVKVNITDAQMRSANSVPVTLVAAPGAGKILVPLGLWITGNVTSGFSVGATVSVVYSGVAIGTFLAAFVVSCQSTGHRIAGTQVSLAQSTLITNYVGSGVDAENKALILSCSADRTGGVTTYGFNVHVLYLVLDMA